MIVILGVDVMSCLCWVAAPFLGFCCHLCILGMFGGCGLPGSEYFWVPLRFSHWGSWVECTDSYWEDGVKGKGMRGTTRRRKARSAKRLGGVPREWRQRGYKPLQVVWYRAGDQTGELELDNRKKREGKWRLPSNFQVGVTSWTPSLVTHGIHNCYNWKGW